ncbi:MAG: hypothetical protein QOC66_3212, partial [Pseudonocardiales bacterium]|nr:hypothetical protein [Pseudonocardiales bacterium]
SNGDKVFPPGLGPHGALGRSYGKGVRWSAVLQMSRPRADGRRPGPIAAGQVRLVHNGEVGIRHDSQT